MLRDLHRRVQSLESMFVAGGVIGVGPGDRPDPQEIEAYIALWKAEEAQITRVMRRQLSEPVDPGDRHNLARAVLLLLHRVNQLEALLAHVQRTAPSD